MSIVMVTRRVDARDLKAAEADPYGAIELLADEQGEAAGSGRMVEVDQAWHAIALVLGQAPEGDEGDAAQAVHGGRPIGEDAGYGPARVHDPLAVGKIAAALGDVSPEVARQRFASVMQNNEDIHPGELAVAELEESVLDGLDRLGVLYRDAAAAGESVITGFM